MTISKIITGANYYKFEKRQVYSSFKGNIMVPDLADMQLVNIFNEGFQFLLCVIDVLSKYAWVILLKDRKGISTTNAV